MELSSVQNTKLSPKACLKWAVVVFIVLVNLYADIKMYMNGDIAYPLLDLVLVGVGVYVFVSKKMYAQRYAFPSVAGMTAFIIFPLIYTLWISFTNYSGAHVMSVDSAMAFHLQKTYKSEGGDFAYKIYALEDGTYELVLSQGDKSYMLEKPFDFTDKTVVANAALGKTLDLNLVATSSQPSGKLLPMKALMSLRNVLKTCILHVPESSVKLSMSGLRQFSAQSEKFTRLIKGEKAENGYEVDSKYALWDNESKQLFLPNMDTGFYQYADGHGVLSGEEYAPGFKVNVGFKNYIKFLSNESIRMPFLQIFVWTVCFSAITVFGTLAIGMILACLVQWEFLRFRGIYRVFLILPYAVPSFISILVFKGLFNQNFGELNMFVNAIMGPIYSAFGSQWTPIEWFTSPWPARAMILMVNAWLGYPYMMLLCMGLLKSIPDDLYEATSIEGASPWVNLRYITLPLLIRPLAPLLIASFAFNFNNFVLIQLLTGGGPDIIEATQAPAGYTDLLVSFTYRIAFEGGKGNDYGLAAAVAAMIFVMVGLLSLVQLRLAKNSQMQG
ncbi:MAG: maltose ABC transporter permease MalF [Aeromonadales bacterium]|nr:maltose ABC transporter permease MalF [Aeromonadales bacterium]